MLAGCAWVARRRSDRDSLLAIVTGGILLVTAVVTAAKSPITAFGAYSPHGLRWLWPLAAFVFFAVVVTLVRRVAAHPRSVIVVVGALTLVAVVLAGLNLPRRTWPAWTPSSTRSPPSSSSTGTWAIWCTGGRC